MSELYHFLGCQEPLRVGIFPVYRNGTVQPYKKIYAFFIVPILCHHGIRSEFSCYHRRQNAVIIACVIKDKNHGLVFERFDFFLVTDENEFYSNEKG